jgi:hypothetical protein
VDVQFTEFELKFGSWSTTVPLTWVKPQVRAAGPCEPLLLAAAKLLVALLDNGRCLDVGLCVAWL